MRVNEVTVTGKKLTDLLDEQRIQILKDERIDDYRDKNFNLTFDNAGSTTVYIENGAGMATPTCGISLYAGRSITFRTKDLRRVSLCCGYDGATPETNSDIRVIPS